MKQISFFVLAVILLAGCSSSNNQNPSEKIIEVSGGLGWYRCELSDNVDGVAWQLIDDISESGLVTYYILENPPKEVADKPTMHFEAKMRLKILKQDEFIKLPYRQFHAEVVEVLSLKEDHHR